MYSRKRNRPRRLFITLGLLAAFALIALAFSPRVISFSPAPDSEDVPSSSALVLEFSQSMDPNSVETRLTVDPSLPGEFVWQDRVLRFQPQGSWPRGETIRVRLQAGSRSAQFLPILRSYSWDFRVGEPRLAYLWPASGPADIYIRSFEDSSTQRLTESPFGVLDFSLSLDGTTFVYSQLKADGGSDLFTYDLLDGQANLIVPCPAEVRCQNPVLASNGLDLAYERSAQTTQVWIKTSEAEPIVIADTEGDSLSPAWSPDGHLAFYDQALEAVMIFSGEVVQSIPNSLGMLGAWSPDGNHLLLPEIAFPDGTGGYISHLVLADVARGSITDLSKESSGDVEDASPAFSPDGEWIAFARKYVDDRWTPGRQLWVMRSDGSLAQPLTDAPDFNHSGFVWNPESDSILFTRFNLTDPSAPPEIWLMEVESKSARRLVQGGMLPQWIP
jgi:Tol biopolymer transport system component